MNKIDFYLTHDHAARQRTMYLSVGIGALVGGIAQALGASLNASTVACILATGLVEVLAILKYVLPDRKTEREIAALPARRYLVRAGSAALVLLLSITLRIPDKAMAAFEQQLHQAAVNPTLSTNSQKAKKVLEEAHAVTIKMSPDVVGKTGARFIEASEQNIDAWGATQQYLDYRSFLNKDFVPDLGELTVWKDSRYRSSINLKPSLRFDQRPLRSLSVWFAGGYVSPDKSARLESFDHPQTESSGIGLFVIDGGADTFVLDGMYMKNVIVRNSDVAYDGGRVTLANVYFVNCKFQFQQTPSAIALGKIIITSAPVTFVSP